MNNIGSQPNHIEIKNLNDMLKLKSYQQPVVDVVEFAQERGFCATIEFGVDVQGIAKPGSFGMDDMTESTDNAAW